MEYNGENLVGRSYGRLTVLAYVGKNRHNKALWKCLCACGTEKVIYGGSLRQGITVSCGCYRKEQAMKATVTHGLYGHPLYRVWEGMKSRCQNQNSAKFEDYGGRGITVCDRWQLFVNFYEDMSPTWSEGLELEREKNDQGYSPENCKWATRTEQTRNTRRNRRYTIDGVEKVLVDWVEYFGVVEYGTVQSRLRAGWRVLEALTTPINPAFRNGNARQIHSKRG